MSPSNPDTPPQMEPSDLSTSLPHSQTGPAPSFPPPHDTPHHLGHFASSETSHPPNMDRSPPGMATSTSSNTPATYYHANTTAGPSLPSNNKQYSFVPLPGNGVKKRPRRRYDEIEHPYQCSWQDCIKSYGTLNHLNAHITMQKHGPKRSPNEFKELHKQWQKAKEEETASGTLD